MKASAGAGPPVSLRRADWRFLLPYPAGGLFEHLVLLGGPPGLAERLLEVGFAKRVTVEIPKEQSADAVVILHDARPNLKTAAACLVPGGALYCEVDRRSAKSVGSTPGTVVRALRSAGLSRTAIYWALPNFVRCKCYLPLDAPGAIQWYLAAVCAARSPLYRLIEVAVRTLAGLGRHRMASLLPIYVVTAVAGQGSNAAPSVLGHPALPAEMRNSDLCPLVLTSGYDEGSRVVMLPFARGGVEPTVALKISRLADFNINTEREQRALTEMRTSLDGSMRRSIPRPVADLHYGGLFVAVQSCAAGRSLLATSGRWRGSLSEKISDLRLAANWLCAFHQQVQLSRVQWNDVEYTKWVEPRLAAYVRVFGLLAGEEQLFANVRRRASDLVATSLPIVWQHNDFGPWNLYRSGDDITVIDWEFGHDWERDRLGPPLCDLLYFVTHWSNLARGLYGEKAELRGFRELFVKPNLRDEIFQAIQRVIREYMGKLGIDRRYFPLLLVWTWIERALDCFNRKQTLAGEGSGTRFDNRYVDYIGILAEDSDLLFDGAVLQEH